MMHEVPTAWPLFDLVGLVGRHGDRQGYAVVFVCYLDDSDDRLSIVATLAGYVARLDDWKAFEADVEPIFRDYGADVLHAKDLHNTKECFENWTRIKKRSFITEVYDVASRHVPFGLSISARKSLVKRWKKERRKNSVMSPYGVCFASIMHTTMYNNSMSEQIRHEGISFIVESGHNNNTEIEKYFHKFRTDEMYDGYAKSITFVGKNDSRAIQIADFFAFHSRRFAHVSERLSGKLALPAAELYDIAASKIPHFPDIISGEVRKATRADAMRPRLGRGSF